MKSIDPADKRFVVAWQKAAAEGQTLDELAKSLEASPKRCGSKAAYLRRHGVQLKRLKRRSGPSKDWTELQKIAVEAGK